MTDKPVDSMLGLYILKGGATSAEPLRRLRLRSKASAPLVHESCFAPSLEVGCTLDVRLVAHEPTTLVLMPATYGAGQAGPFALQLASDARLSWQELL